MRQNRAWGFTPARAGLAACTLTAIVVGGVIFGSGPARTESGGVALTSTGPQGGSDGGGSLTAEDMARQAARLQLAETMRRKQREEQAKLEKVEAEKLAVASAQEPARTTTTETPATGSVASASIASEAAQPAPVPQAGGAQIATPPVAAPPMQMASIAPEDMQRLAGKAAEAIRNGDIASARLVLEHAARAGDATALYALAETYDPRVLSKMRVQGMTGDSGKAQDLYRQALESGVEEARARLSEGG